MRRPLDSPRAATRRQFLAQCAAAGVAGLLYFRTSEALAAAEDPLYRSPEGRAAVTGLYERQLASLPFPHESLAVATRYGQTHVLALGSPSAPPLVVLHGVNFASAFTAPLVQPFSADFRVYIPDMVGQPGHSAERRPPTSEHGYARWLEDVLDGLNIRASAMLGISFGGAVVLDLATVAPTRISKAVLVVPGGFKTSLLTIPPMLFRLFLPWTVYRYRPDRARISRTLHPLAWEMNDASYDFFDALLRHVHWLNLPPGPFSADDLRSFTAPVAVYGARHDIFFPGEDLIREARKVIVNVADTEVYDSSHYPTQQMQTAMTQRAHAFLASPTEAR